MTMEKCPKCGRISAERNHYTGLLICYNRSCDYKEKEFGQSKDDMQKYVIKRVKK